MAQARERNSESSSWLVMSAFDAIARGLLEEDPHLARRLRRARRAEVRNVVAVVALLVVSTVLLAVGFAARSALPWFAGGAAFFASFVVDDRYRRRLAPVLDQPGRVLQGCVRFYRDIGFR